MLRGMSAITDTFIRDMLAKSRLYTVIIMKSTPKRHAPGADVTSWEHVRFMFEQRAAGRISIICPFEESGELAAVGVFNATVEETRRLMDEDPAIKAGMFTYEAYPARSFPGDSLPA
jgi:hypothetical protein